MKPKVNPSVDSGTVTVILERSDAVQIKKVISDTKTKLSEEKLNMITANPIETSDSDRIKPTVIYIKSKIENLPQPTKKAFALKLIEIN